MNTTTSLHRCFFPLLAAGLFLAALFPLRMHGQYSSYSYPVYYPSGPPATMRAPAGLAGFEVPLERAGHNFSFKWRVRAADPITAGSAQTMGFVTASNVVGDTTMRSVLVTAYTQSTYVYTPVVYTYPGTTYTYTYTAYTAVPFACFDWWLVDLTANEEFYHPGTPGPGEDLRNGAWRQLGSIPTRSFIIPEARLGHALVAGSPAGGWSPVTSGYSTFGTYSNGSTGTQVPLHWFTGSAPLGAGDFSIADRSDGTKAPLNQTNVSGASWVHDYAVYPLASVTFYLPAAEMNNLYVLHYQIPGQVAAVMSVWPTAVGAAFSTATVNASQKTIPAGAAKVTGTIAVGASFWLTRNIDGSTAPTFTLTSALANSTTPKVWSLALPPAAVSRVPMTFGIASTRAAQTFTVAQPSSFSATSPGSAAVRPVLSYEDYAPDHTPNFLRYFTVTAQVNPAEPFNLMAQTAGGTEMFSQGRVWVLDGWTPIGGTAGTPPVGTPGQFTFTLKVTGPEPAAGLTLTAPNGTPYQMAPSAPTTLSFDDAWHPGMVWAAVEKTWTLTLPYTGPLGDWSLTNPVAGQDWSLPLNAGTTTNYVRDFGYQAKVKPLALNISLSRWAFDTAPRLRLRQRDGSDFPVNARSTTAWASLAPDATVWTSSSYSFLVDTSVRDGVDYWVYDEETGEESPYNTTDLITWFALPTPAGLTGAVNQQTGMIDLQWPLGLASLDGGFEIERLLSGATAWQTIDIVPANTADASEVLHFSDPNPVLGKIHTYRIRYIYGADSDLRHSASSNLVALNVAAWLDSDGDGIPDWWENLYGLDRLNPNDAQDMSNGGEQTNLERYNNNSNPNAPLVPVDPANPNGPKKDAPPLDDLPHIMYAAVDVSSTTQAPIQAPISLVALDDNNHLAFAYSDTTNHHSVVWANGTPGPTSDFGIDLPKTVLGDGGNPAVVNAHRFMESLNASGTIAGTTQYNTGDFNHPYNEHAATWSMYFIDDSVNPSEIGSGPSGFWFEAYFTGYINFGNSSLISGHGETLNGWFTGTGAPQTWWGTGSNSYYTPWIFSSAGDSAGQTAADEGGLSTTWAYAVVSGTSMTQLGSLFPVAVGDGGKVLGSYRLNPLDPSAKDPLDLVALWDGISIRHLKTLLPEAYAKGIRFPGTSSGWVNGNGDLVVDAEVFQTPPPVTIGPPSPVTWLPKTLLWQRPATGPQSIAILDLPAGDFSLKQFNASRCFAAIGRLQAQTDPNPHALLLLPVDLDVIHPASGELSDAKEDVGDGGYVSVRRLVDGLDVTPVTKLVIRAVGGAQAGWKTRLKFTPGDRYKIYSDEARTQEVTSEQTEFDATQEKMLYFQGLKKSQSRGGEEIKMQVGLGGQWYDGDSLKCTVVQSEFLVQVKAFIPYNWTEPESPFNLGGWIAKGDNRGFRNTYSSETDRFNDAPFRVCQTIVVTPYEELHATPDIVSERHAWTAPLSEHFNKAASVNPAEMSQRYGYGNLAGNRTSFGKPPLTMEAYYRVKRSRSHEAELEMEARGEDGAMGAAGNTAFVADIHWKIWFGVAVDDPLRPTIGFDGKHDRYPSYEIIVIQSNGTYKDIHRVPARANDYPGPISLGDGNGPDVGRTDQITD